MLRPGGRFAVSDVDRRPGHGRGDPRGHAAWTGCIAGALTERRVPRSARRRGLRPTSRSSETHRVHEHAGSAIVRARKPTRSLSDDDRRGAGISLAARSRRAGRDRVQRDRPCRARDRRFHRRRSATIGLLVASFPAGMVAGFGSRAGSCAAPARGSLLRPALALVALGALGFVLGDSLAVYFPARLLMGIGSGGIWIGVTFDTLERWPGQEYRLHEPHVRGVLGGRAHRAGAGRLRRHSPAPSVAYLALSCSPCRSAYSWMSPPATRRDFSSDRGRTPNARILGRLRPPCCSPSGTRRLEGVLPLHFAERLSQARDRSALGLRVRSSSPQARGGSRRDPAAAAIDGFGRRAPGGGRHIARGNGGAACPSGSSLCLLAGARGRSSGSTGSLGPPRRSR